MTRASLVSPSLTSVDHIDIASAPTLRVEERMCSQAFSRPDNQLPLVMHLCQQHRCHPHISRLCNELFYPDLHIRALVNPQERLPILFLSATSSRCGHSTANSSTNFGGHYPLTHPVPSSQLLRVVRAAADVCTMHYEQGRNDTCWVAAALACIVVKPWGERHRERRVSRSLTSPVEAAVITHVLRQLTANSFPINASKVSVGVICLYRAQADLLRVQLKKRLPNLTGNCGTNQHGGRNATTDLLMTEKATDHRLAIDLEVSTVDAFQGSEKDVIILSCVRSANNKPTSSPVPTTSEGSFCSCPRRLCVALSRCKSQLIIVGSEELLSPSSRTAAGEQKRLADAKANVRRRTGVSSPQATAAAGQDVERGSIWQKIMDAAELVLQWTPMQFPNVGG
eukprot:GHVS01069643.1.p2 GENE.GHVS01069643.1~~GHVS01069643.1.p2  ORF type:complete len:396 (-),score=61.55 GHVS01069643.1:776-1963(-)